MRVLVTGGNGYLGSQLVIAHLEKGNDVAVLEKTHRDTFRIKDYLENVEFYSLDENDPAKPFEPGTSIDVVIHAAISYGRQGESVFDVFQTNAAFALKMLDLAVKYGTPLFINIGTSVNRSLNAYSLSKAQFREWGEHFAAREAITFCNAQLEHFYGPGDSDVKFSTSIIRQCLANVPQIKLTPGEQRRDFIYIDDAVSALMILSDDPDTGTYFKNYQIGSGSAVPVRFFAELVKKISGSETSLDFGAIPYRKNEDMFLQADISAVEALGWGPEVSLEDGLRMTIEAEKLTI